MKKIFPIFLLTLLLFTACGGEQAVQTTTAATENAVTTTIAIQTEPPVQDLTLIEADGRTAFTVVRADEADGLTVNVAIELQSTLNSIYAAKVGISSDISLRKEADGTVVNDKYEILIGDTNRPESIAARAELEECDTEDDYIICVKGKKLVILGKNGFSTKYAVKLFMEQYLGQGGEALIIPGDMRLMGQGAAASIALTEGADLRVMTFNLRGGEDNPNVRFANIQETILTYMPDVIGFQEANNGPYAGVLHQLDDYAIVETEMPTNCTPIIYLKDKYTQVDGGCQFLRMRNTETGTKSIAWVVLRVNETGKTFCVINLHGALVAEWRVDNVRQMLELKERIKSQYGDIAILFTGDFNFKNTEAAYQATLDAGLTEAEVSAEVRMEGSATWHTIGYAPGEGLSIDHIFYHPDDVAALRHHIAKAEGFELDASDHCAVWADVRLLK